MVLLIDYDLLNLKEKFSKPNYNLIRYFAYYKQYGLVQMITSIAQLQNTVQAEKVYIFSDKVNVSKVLLKETIVPLLQKQNTNIQFNGLGFFGFFQALPPEVAEMEPDYSAYFPWLRQLVTLDMITPRFCHQFTKTDILHITEANHKEILEMETKNKYCALAYNDFIYEESSLWVLNELERKYTIVRFYQPFLISQVPAVVLAKISGSHRIHNNSIIINTAIRNTTDVTEKIRNCPVDGKIIFYCGYMRNYSDTAIQNELEKFFEWTELALIYKKLPRVFVKKSFLETIHPKWKAIYAILKMWINYDRHLDELSFYETAETNSIDRSEMKARYGEPYDHQPTIYRKDNYIEPITAFAKANWDFAKRYLFMKSEYLAPKKEEYMDNLEQVSIYEIKRNVDDLEAQMEEAVQEGMMNMILNPNIQILMNQLYVLQNQCPHETEDGSALDKNHCCTFCRKKIV